MKTSRPPRGRPPAFPEPFVTSRNARRRRRRERRAAARQLWLGSRQAWIIGSLLVLISALAFAPSLYETHTGHSQLSGTTESKSHFTSPFGLDLAHKTHAIRVVLTPAPRAGVLFDIDSGHILWEHHLTRKLPIASLTKMMTGLVVADRVPIGSKVRVTKEALAYQGSGVGVLPRNRWVGVNAMLHGLFLPSGNDAAIALAQRAAGSVVGFVQLMNQRAQAMKLDCTEFSSPDGFIDSHNHSCAIDLAALARALLNQPRLARIVRRREAVMPFPIKGGRIYLHNNNPLLRQRYPGTIGVKTGYTDAAGHCLVAAVQRGRRRLGLVLLHSPDTGSQARRIFDTAFGAPALGHA